MDRFAELWLLLYKKKQKKLGVNIFQDSNSNETANRFMPINISKKRPLSAGLSALNNSNANTRNLDSFNVFQPISCLPVQCFPSVKMYFFLGFDLKFLTHFLAPKKVIE